MTRLIARLRSDERGVAAIEFAIVAPIVLLLLVGSAVYFTSARNDYRAKRATYTVADIVSRQSSVTDSFLGAQRAMFANLAHASSDSVVRITSVSKPTKDLVVDWSYAVAPLTALKSGDLVTLSLPNIPVGESIVVFEGRAPYQPVFAMFGSATVWRTNVAVMRPRSGAKIPKS